MAGQYEEYENLEEGQNEPEAASGVAGDEPDTYQDDSQAGNMASNANDQDNDYHDDNNGNAGGSDISQEAGMKQLQAATSSPQQLEDELKSAQSLISQQNQKILKLSKLNQRLNQQLKEFSRTLDQVLRRVDKGAAPVRPEPADMVSAQEVHVKEMELKNVLKKLEIAQREIQMLRKQSAANSLDRVSELENQVAEKDLIVKRQQSELKTLNRLLKEAEKASKEHDSDFNPTAQFEQEIRVLKERLRQVEGQYQEGQKAMMAQHQQFTELNERYRKLKNKQQQAKPT